MTTRLRAIPVAVGILVSCASAATAQIVVTPFASVNLSTTPGFFDLDDAAKDLHGGLGLAVSFLTDRWIQVEGETLLAPSAFSGHDLVESSRLVTASGAVLVTAPRRWGPHVRPYVSLGAGVAQISSVDVGRFFVTDSIVPIATAGIGVWAWFHPRMGIRAGLRFVRSLRRVEFDSLETWQPSVGLSLRF